ncbi:MAG: pseudouridine synthase [Sphingomonas sp.]
MSADAKSMYQRGVSPSSPPKEPQRIAKLLARAGIASRREIERMIAKGRIAIDGKTLDTPATLVTSLHGVTVDGNPVEAPRPARLFVFHKPRGVLTTERDPAGRPTIYDHLPRDLPRVMPVGRLDLNTEGLLLLTTDGGLKRELELPATGVERAYRARAYGEISQEQLESLIEGIEIEGIRYGSIDANLERRTGANVWIEMILTEGKNREVRRVLEHLGLEVSRLIRTRYGPFVIADLPVGAIGEVRQHDLVAFRQGLGKGRKDDAAIVVEPIGPAPNVRVPRTASARAEPVEDRTGRPGRAKPDRSSDSGRPPKANSAYSAVRPEPVEGRLDRKPVARSARPSTSSSRRTAEEPAKPQRPKRGAGWAKAKPRPRPQGKPRGPRRK